MDRLVRLYDLQPVELHLNNLLKDGVIVRHAMAYEKTMTESWVCNNFSVRWADECSVSFSNHPVSCFIATENGEIIGFACYESTCKNFFGPIGVADNARGRGIGKALLLSCLHSMAAMGYAYAVIGGGDGVSQFYKNNAGAMEIDNSDPSIYRDRLKDKEN